jgi:hypothetical protein
LRGEKVGDLLPKIYILLQDWQRKTGELAALISKVAKLNPKKGRTVKREVLWLVKQQSSNQDIQQLASFYPASKPLIAVLE